MLDILDPETKYGNVIEIPNEDYFDLMGDYEFLGWSTSEYSFGDPIPSIEFEGGEILNVDDLAAYENSGNITFYAVIVESGYTYTKNVVEATFEKDGYIDFTCNEDPSKSYRQTISKNSLFYSYIEDVYVINGRGTVITTTIAQGSIKINETITVVLKDGTVRNDVVIKGIEVNNKTRSSAMAGENVGILVDLDKDTLQRGGFMCEQGKAIHTDSIYARAYVPTKDEGGRHSAFFVNYRPQFVIGGITYTCIVTGIYDIYTGEVVETGLPGNTYILKIQVPENAGYTFYTWVGKEHTTKESDKVTTQLEVVARTDAQYEEYMQYCDVRVDLQDGSDLKYYRVSRDALVKDLPRPTREGYTFLGWADQADLYLDLEIYELMDSDNAIYYSTLRPIGKLYAQWLKNDLIVESSEIKTGRGVVAYGTANTDIYLMDEAIIFTGTDFIYGSSYIVTNIIINGKSVEPATAGTENAGIVIRGLENELPEGSIIMIKKKS